MISAMKSPLSEDYRERWKLYNEETFGEGPYIL